MELLKPCFKCTKIVCVCVCVGGWGINYICKCGNISVGRFRISYFLYEIMALLSKEPFLFFFVNFKPVIYQTATKLTVHTCGTLTLKLCPGIQGLLGRLQ